MKQSVDDFLAAGGSVTRCPPGEAKTQPATFAHKGVSIVDTPRAEATRATSRAIGKAKRKAEKRERRLKAQPRVRR